MIQKKLELNTTHFHLLHFILGKHTEVRELRIGVVRNQVLAVSSANIENVNHSGSCFVGWKSRLVPILLRNRSVSGISTKQALSLQTPDPGSWSSCLNLSVSLKDSPA